MTKSSYKLALVFITLFLSWTLYRAHFTFTIWIDEFLVKPLLWIVPLLIIVKVRNLSQLEQFGLHKQQFVQTACIGIVIGIVFSAVRIASMYLRLGYLGFTPYDLLPLVFVKHLGISLATAVVEEFVFRGYFLQEIVKRFPDGWLANTLTTILFIIIHIPVVVFTLRYAPGDALVYLTIIGLVSIVSGLLFLRMKNLVSPIAFHATWNLFSSIVR